MSLSHVAVGQAHVAAHNAERDAINNAQETLDDQQSKLATAPDGYVWVSNGDGTGEFRAQDDVIAAATTAALGALTTAGVLTASNAPVLDSTRVPDPQGKTSGGSGGAQFPITRITTSLPSGISYGIKTVRTGTLSGVISQVYLGSKTNTDPLRIPVTPAEQATFAACEWTDQAASRARLDVFFYDSSGTLLSTSFTGVYVNIAQNTWEQRVTSGVVPATASYAILQGVIATVSGSNTVTGAVGAITEGIVVSGTIASPTYVDGTMNSTGWYWSGTPHGSISVKVQYAKTEVETPTGSQAKVDAHAAASDPHPAYLAKSVIPILSTNRALDPQLKNAGASASSGSYSLSRIITGLPVGISYGIMTTRIGSVSAVISQMYLSPATGGQADPLRIPVTPGSVISASAMMLTDQANARARLDLFFCDAAGALVGSAVNGIYSNIVQNSWETRNQINVVIPAGVSYVTVQATISLQSGFGNTVLGAIAKATGLQVVSGTVLPAIYADGSFTGWTWSGSPHVSTSLKLFDVSAGSGTAFTLTKIGNSLALQRLLGAKTLIQNLNLNASGNGGFNIVSATLDGAVIHTSGDDICPIRTQLGTVGANHGYSNIRTFTNSDGKTSADLGSEWQDTAGRHYVLLGFTVEATPKLIVGGDYTTPGGVTTSLDVAPTTNLTHVAGATHTGAIAFGTAAAGTDLLPAIARITTTSWADGKPVTVDGAIPCHKFVVRESYSILDYGAIYDAAKANVGVSYSTLIATISGCVRVSNTYCWTASGCRITTSLTELKPTTLAQCGAVQSAVMTPPTVPSAGSITRYLPGIGTVSGFNWGAGVSMTGYSTDVLIASTDVVVSGRPPCVSLDVMADSTSAVIVGFAMGYLPYGKRGDELSTNANRLTHAPTKLWDLRGTQKNYPTFTTSEAAGWGHIAVESFRAYIDPTQVLSVLASKGDAVSAWEALSTSANLEP